MNSNSVMLNYQILAQFLKFIIIDLQSRKMSLKVDVVLMVGHICANYYTTEILINGVTFRTQIFLK